MAKKLRVGVVFGGESGEHEVSLAGAASVLAAIDRERFEELLFLRHDLAHDVLWSAVRILAKRLRETNDKLTFLSVTSKF